MDVNLLIWVLWGKDIHGEMDDLGTNVLLLGLTRWWPMKAEGKGFWKQWSTTYLL